MAKSCQHVKFEELISLQDAGDWLKGEYLYVLRGRKQISQIRLEDLQMPKDKATTGQIEFVDFLLKDILKDDESEKSDNDRPLGLARIGELALLLKREYSPNSNAFVWRGVRREIFPLIFVGSSYRVADNIIKLCTGKFEFYQINQSYFRERQEAITQCIEEYHRKQARIKSSSEPQP